jgi:hypothetical protein
MRTKRTNLNLGQIYAAPLALAVLTAIGLVAALLADGVWDGVSWIALAAPVAMVVWFIGKWG